MDRFRQFTEGELHEIRFGLEAGRKRNLFAQRPNDDVDRLLGEIKDEQVQREHAAARQMVVA